MADKLKDCPFCGSGVTEYVDGWRYGGVELYPKGISGMPEVYCNVCSSIGPPRKTSEEAVSAWNTRTVKSIPNDPWGWWLKDLTSDGTGFLIRNPDRLTIATPPEEWAVIPLYTESYSCHNDADMSIQKAAKILHSALHTAKIDSSVLRLLYDGQVNAGLSKLIEGYE